MTAAAVLCLAWALAASAVALPPGLCLEPSSSSGLLRTASAVRGPRPQMPFDQKVTKAYRVPETTDRNFVDTYRLLYPQRIVFLGQEMEDEVCNRLISTMLYMDAEDSTQPVYMYINSPGGSVIAGLALYDTMFHMGSGVITVNIGMAASMASFILGAGTPGKRIALPQSRVMIHQPMGGTDGQAEDVRVEAEQIIKIKGTLVTMYSQMTGQTPEVILKDLGFDNYMSAQQALEYGLIDKIVDVQ